MSGAGPPGRLRRPAVVALSGLALVFAASYSVVRPTNSSGWDEWLVIDLTSRGALSIPFNNRPLSLLFNLAGSLLTPRGLTGFWLVHGAYLWLASACVYLLARRLEPDRPRLALLAAALAATWAPLDAMRLDPVLLSNYSGATATACLGLVLLAEAAVGARWWLAVAGGACGAVAVRAVDSTAALLLAGPLLLWVLPQAVVRRRRARCALLWFVPLVPAVALATRPLWPGAQRSYQLAGLGFDPSPWGVLSRLAAQLRFQLLPLVTTDPRELLVPSAAAAAAFLALCWALLGRRRPSLAEGPAPGLRFLATGLAGAVLGHAVLVLSPSMRTPMRMQIVSAPGMGIFLCGVMALASAWLPARLRRVVLPLAGCVVVALGSARTAALQREWDRSSSWPGQSATLAGVTRLAPAIVPGTLLLLLDRTGTWPASFTFRHAVRYLYGSGVTGAVWDTEPYLYPFRFVPGGVLTEPYELLRRDWAAPVTLHTYGAVVVLRVQPGGGVELLRDWPDELPPLPGGAVYDPAARIRAGPPPERSAILAGARARGLR